MSAVGFYNNGCPEELLRCICLYLPVEEQLFTVPLVCHYWRNIVGGNFRKRALFQLLAREIKDGKLIDFIIRTKRNRDIVKIFKGSFIPLFTGGNTLFPVQMFWQENKREINGWKKKTMYYWQKLDKKILITWPKAAWVEVEDICVKRETSEDFLLKSFIVVKETKITAGKLLIYSIEMGLFIKEVKKNNEVLHSMKKKQVFRDLLNAQLQTYIKSVAYHNLSLLYTVQSAQIQKAFSIQCYCNKEGVLQLRRKKMQRSGYKVTFSVHELFVQGKQLRVLAWDSPCCQRRENIQAIFSGTIISNTARLFAEKLGISLEEIAFAADRGIKTAAFMK